MSDYTRSYDGAAKDAAESVLAGSDFDSEFDLIETAVNSKADKVTSPTTNGIALLDANGNLIDSGNIVKDASSNEIFQFAASGSAVNYFKALASATGADLILSALGDDTNIDIDIQTKGTGKLLYNGTEVSTGAVTFDGCMVNDSTSQSIPNATTTTLNWDNEAYDVNSWHDTVTNNSRLTVPSGVGYVVVKAQIEWGSTSWATPCNMWVALYKNGVNTYAGYTELRHMFDTNGYDLTMHLVSPPIAVSATDYFEIKVWHNEGSAQNVNMGTTGNASWFAIEKVG